MNARHWRCLHASGRCSKLQPELEPSSAAGPSSDSETHDHACKPHKLHGRSFARSAADALPSQGQKGSCCCCPPLRLGPPVLPRPEGRERRAKDRVHASRYRARSASNRADVHAEGCPESGVLHADLCVGNIGGSVDGYGRSKLWLGPGPVQWCSVSREAMCRGAM